MTTQPSPLESLYQEDLYQLPGKIIVVIAKEWVDISEEERAVLSKMLVAVKQSLTSVQILNLKSFSIEDLASMSPSKVLVFGSILKEVPDLYSYCQVNGLSIIVAESIDKLDDAKKKSLWQELRKMFGI